MKGDLLAFFRLANKPAEKAGSPKATDSTANTQTNVSPLTIVASELQHSSGNDGNSPAAAPQSGGSSSGNAGSSSASQSGVSAEAQTTHNQQPQLKSGYTGKNEPAPPPPLQFSAPVSSAYVTASSSASPVASIERLPSMKRAKSDKSPSTPVVDAAVTSRFSFATVCACNINRSTSAHEALLNRGFHEASVTSFGTADCVRVPSFRGPAIVPFNHPYLRLLQQLCGPTAEDAHFARVMGLVALLQRNAKLKAAPQRWQEQSTPDALRHDFILCFDGTVWEALRADLAQRGLRNASALAAATTARAGAGAAPSSVARRSVHVILLHTQDNIADAAVAGETAATIAQELALTIPLGPWDAPQQQRHNAAAAASCADAPAAKRLRIDTTAADSSIHSTDSIELPAPAAVLQLITPDKGGSGSSSSRGGESAAAAAIAAADTPTPTQPEGLDADVLSVGADSLRHGSGSTESSILTVDVSVLSASNSSSSSEEGEGAGEEEEEEGTDACSLLAPTADAAPITPVSKERRKRGREESLGGTQPDDADAAAADAAAADAAAAATPEPPAAVVDHSGGLPMSHFVRSVLRDVEQNLKLAANCLLHEEWQL